MFFHSYSSSQVTRCQNSGKVQEIIWNKNIIKKVKFSFFFGLLCTKPLKCMQSHLYGEIKRLCQKTVLWVFFSMLGTNTIKPKKVNLYGNPKQNYWKRVFSVFYVENAKTDANQPKWRNIITLPKSNKSFLNCYLQKMRKWMESTLYWEAKGTKKHVKHQNDK